MKSERQTAVVAYVQSFNIRRPTQAAGKGIAPYRADILERATGKRPPLTKCGINRLIPALAELFDIDGSELCHAELCARIDKAARGEA